MQAENKLPTDTIVEFIKTFVETEDGYTVGQTAAQYAYPFIQPVPFPEEENKKDRHKNMVNGYLGAGYATAIDRLAPFIRATLQQRSQMM